MEYGLYSKQHHPHPRYRTKDEVVKNEQLTELIYISTSGVALSLGEAKSWDHLGGLKSLPNFWHSFFSWAKLVVFSVFSPHSLSLLDTEGSFLWSVSGWKVFFVSFCFLCTKRDYISFCHSRVRYPPPSQAYFSCASNLIAEVCRATQR